MTGKINSIKPSWQGTELRHSKHTDHAMLLLKIELKISIWHKPAIPQYGRMLKQGGETLNRYAAESARLLNKEKQDTPAIADFRALTDAEQATYCEIAENPQPIWYTS